MRFGRAPRVGCRAIRSPCCKAVPAPDFNRLEVLLGLTCAMHDINSVKENQLLAALPADSLERLLPAMESVILPPAEILFDYEDALTHLYFPGKNSVVSFQCRTDERENVEVGLCGNEGAVGVAGLFGVETSAQENLVQVPGTGFRLAIEAARNEFRRGGRFQELVLKFNHSLFIQVSQTALCNRLHSDEERLARWLLLSNDRVNADQLPLPRELLAKLLGRSLSTASLTVTLLERAGLITNNGSELGIVNREKLEMVSCSCYWVVRREAAKVLKSSSVDI
jgi:CRP-like cAMP-binding protein